MTRGYGYFAKNVGLLTVSNFGSKLLSFFLVPLYTNVLTTEQYGTYDILYTSVSLLIPLLTININEGVMRFCLEGGADNGEVLSVAMRIYVPGSFLLAVFLTLNHTFALIPMLDEYAVLFLLLYLSSSLNGILVMYARGADHVDDIAISGIVCSIVMLGLSILLLVVLPCGLIGYFVANIAGLTAQCAYIGIRERLWKSVSLRRPSVEGKILSKHMMAYTTPMIANSVSWWVISAAGRYAVIWLCGAAVNGVFSASYKIPSILSVLQSIVYSAWVLSAVQDFDPEDRSGFFSNTYNAYGFAMCMLCSTVMIIDKPVAGFLYGKDFYEAWMYVPPLLISIVFLSLASFLGGVYSAVKDSKAYARSSAVAAACNVVLSVLLVWQIGVMGASVAAAISYAVMLAMRIKGARKYVKLRFRLTRDCAVYVILSLQAALLVAPFEGEVLRYALQFICLLAVLVLYRGEAAAIVRLAVGKMRRGRIHG